LQNLHPRENFCAKEDVVALEVNDGVCPWIANFSSLKELVMRSEGMEKLFLTLPKLTGETEMSFMLKQDNI
jgi:hypothetical protein